MSGESLVPGRYQPALPINRLILETSPDPEHVSMDVVFVGGGPAGLSGAIELARLIKRDSETGGTLGDVQIAVLEKASALGEHSLSGAVVNPVALRELFPDVPIGDLPLRAPVKDERVLLLTENRAIRIPMPPTMRNDGNYIASLCEMVRWLGAKAEEAGVNIFAGFPVDSLIVQNGRVVGVRTTPSGLDRSGQPGSDYTAPTDITGKVTVIAEGTRGPLAAAYMQWQRITSENPQIFALGVKEIWETRQPLKSIVHTLGWPLPSDAFGGSFMYPLEENLVAVGLVVGLDYRSIALDVHVLLQRLKLHPFFRSYFDGGEMVEWGAKTIPEGGYYAVPERRHGDGVLIVGDAAGLVEVASLKGIHYAMQSGIFAARAIFAALKRNDTSAAALQQYDRLVDQSFIREDLYSRRNLRLAFQGAGFYRGGAKAALMTLTKGAFPGGKITSHTDAEVARAADGERPFKPDGKLTFGKLDANFKSGNATRDTIPSHLLVGHEIPSPVAELYEHMCPAGVYERDGTRLVINQANCIDCKATDVIGPRWTPREGGSGPHYRRM
ncbi:MAG: 4Fe-4S dicluster domain-containing protein [Gemmatimonadaceae bacterium]